MFARQILALAIAGGVLAGCGTSTVPNANLVSGSNMFSGGTVVPNANANSMLRSLAMSPDSTPSIKKVSPIQATQTQKIVIKGKGFGKMQPYNGDSCCIEITVTNPQCYYYGYYDQWNAGFGGTNPNEVTLNVTKWSKKEIVIAGFTGTYGQGCWTLNSGQPIEIKVWNAQTTSGPATWNGTIQ